MSERKPKVFIIGISGFLGYNLALYLRENFLVSGAYFRHETFIPDVQISPVDISNADMLEAVVRVHAPDFLINAMGLTNRKQIEEMPKMADSLNLILPVSMGVLANKMDCQFIHLSCASIYSGHNGNYKEDDTDFSIHDNFAKQKVAAESYIRAQTMESTILRVGKVMGLGSPHHSSEFDRLRFSLSEKRMVEASQKQQHSYLSTHSLAEAITVVLKGKFPGKHRLYNLGGPTLTEFDFYHGWANLMGDRSKLVKPATDDAKKNYSIQCTSFQTTYPEWKTESQNQIYANLLKDLNPGTGTKKWQKTLQIP